MIAKRTKTGNSFSGFADRFHLRNRGLRFAFAAVLTTFVLISTTPNLTISAQSPPKQGGAPEQKIEFGGTYANLKPEQRRLLDEVYRQYNELMSTNLKAAEEYDGLSLSVRTTFEAVTHALITTKLTDKDGRSLGTALDLISFVESVQGRIPEASGDLQFRMYVVLKPNALQTMENSREFKREGDNTTFHKGYPMNYRQQGKVPTIQVSSALDERRADIDVDYRSSKFPQAVLNGHLRSSNSDVRAGDNFNKHINRWSGFSSWWTSIFGVPLKAADSKDEDIKKGRGDIPKLPREGKGKLELAMYDFLTAWLVEQQPNQSVAYISQRAYPCVDQVASDETKQIIPSLVPYLILEGMKKVNRSVGKPITLGDVSESVHLNVPALKKIDQPYSTDFELFETPDDIAFDFECANRNAPPDSLPRIKPERKYGKYYGASLRIKVPNAKGSTLLVLWTKESDFWKVVSWDVEPDPSENKQMPNAGVAAASHATSKETQTERVAGDPGFNSAVGDFLDAWFVKKDIEKAVAYLSDQCYPCVNLYMDESEKKVRNWDEARRRILSGMKSVADAIGPKSQLTEAIEGVAPAHPALKLVTHSQEPAYTLVSVPDEIAGAFECVSRARGVNSAAKPAGPAVYGNYYGAIFEVKGRGEPAVLKLLWAKEKDQWKIIAYSIETP